VVGNTKCGKGMKLAVVVERRSGVPLAAGTDAANVPEVVLGPAVLAGIPDAISLPPEVPLLGDRGYDSDPLREELAGEGFRLIAPHRENRTKPPTNDGRRLRRYKRRWIVERTFAWVQWFRRVATRYEYLCHLYDGFVALACAFIALGKL
jgi:transposase